MATIYWTKQQIQQIYEEAVSRFNLKMKTTYSGQNIKLFFCTKENGAVIATQAIKEYFPKWNIDEQQKEGYIESIGAEVFIGEFFDGILFRMDVDFDKKELYHIILHELSHIFCVHNEFGGLNFFDVCCAGDDKRIEVYNGYAIWREFIANVIANEIYPIDFIDDKRVINPKIKRLLKDIFDRTPTSKASMTEYLLTVLRYGGAWEETLERIKNNKWCPNECLLDLIKLVYDQLGKKQYWKINEDFMFCIGEEYNSSLFRALVG